MAQAFVDKGYEIISGGTENHCMLIDLRNKNITGKLAEQALVRADITVNKNMVPFDTQSPFVTSGIRIGTAAITTRGFNEEDSLRVVEWIDRIMNDAENETVIAEVKAEVNAFMAKFPLYEDAGVTA
jgi:glycine hydroxymethyltransferase